jgi:RHS repeat-associated protein
MSPSVPSRAVARVSHLFAKSLRKLFAKRPNFNGEQRLALTASRVVSIALVLCLFLSSTPAATQTVVAVAKESSISFAFWFHASGLAKLVQGRGVARAKAQEKQAERDAKISRLQIFPGNATIDLGERVRFSAVAYDQGNNPVGGARIKWSGQSSVPGGRVRLTPHGEFEGTAPGSFTITAEAARNTAQITVVVRPGVLRDLKLAPTSTRQVSTRDEPETKTGSTKELKKSGGSARVSPRVGGDRRGGGNVLAKRAHAGRERITAAPGPMPFLPGDSWGDGNYWSADDPGNGVGNPPGAPLDGGAGSGNFQFVAPILGLPGRGINISLGAAYNSRLWNKAGSQIGYDNDRGWPAPGFSLGFGALLGMGVYNGGMLVDADGTRHGYTGSITFYSWGTYFVGHTTDGSFIDYTYWTGTGGGITWAQARLADGTVVNYGAPGPGAVYPTSIEDANGNYITITYVNNSGPRIQTVTDTLNRVISFYYDYNNLLTAITAPGLGGGTRTLVRFHYHQLGLNYGFSGLTAAVRDSYPWVVDAIYYPATSTGYWLNDSDSYSSYGMLAKVVEERAMGFSASSLNDMGSVSQGQITRAETYNYPLSPDYSLTDAPTYASMTESWTRDGTNLDSATTSYSINENSTPRTTIITQPNGTKSKQLSYNAPGQYNDGLVYHDETYVTEGQALQSSNSYWEPGAYGSPRPTRVEKTDALGQTTAAEFTYGSVYNQVTEVRDYAYGGTTLLRATRTQYQNSASYTNRHIFNLPLSVEVYASDYSTRVSRTENQYDGQAMSPAPNVVQHDQTYNPHADDEGLCYWDYDWNDPDCTGNCPLLCDECIQTLEQCDGYCPQYYVCPYDPSTTNRGNVTQVTSYADAINLTGAITETRRYDIAGNMVTTTTACCQQTSFNYTVDTQYAYPLSKTRGSATDAYAQVTTGATSDFNTGLTLSVTDANGRQSTTTYDANTLRPTSAIAPTGAHTDYGYNDAAMSVTAITYLPASEGGGIAGQNVKLLNGRGQVRQEQALGANNVSDNVDVVFDSMGQVSQQTRPYRSGESQQWITTTYDDLGRTKTVTAPDGSVTQTFYNEASRPSVASGSSGETTRVQDAWGRERWGRTDSSGRLVEVVEPNPAGGGSVANYGMVTTYSYNTLGNLTTINQGSQTRSFSYDSLGRLTAQKLAEAGATLNDAGTYIGSGTWSDVFTYDDRSNLTSRKDARGVKTVYTYSSDPLNRLQSVSWDTGGFGDTANPILAAATVSYQYRTKGSPSDLKDVTQLASVSTSGVSTESYSYDTEGRVISKTLTLTSRSSYPFVTDYIYDTLDRARDVRYPAEYGNGSAPRKVVHHDYDITSRLSGLTYDSQSLASNIVYNAASQTTSLSAGTGTNQVNESYNYNAQTGLLDSQTAARNGTTLLNLSYDHAGANGKRTGQLTKISNNLDHNKDRAYEYDALGRLQRATGGQNVNWVQRYEYDRYGNRANVFSYNAEQVVRNFYQSALNRQPNSTELQTALSNLQTAYAQGQSQFLGVMQSIGETVFGGSEYASRGQSPHDYVRDLYKAYLLREPDQGGWDFWTTQVQNNGQAAVRSGFTWSTEFATKMNGASPYSPGGAGVPADGLAGLGFDNSSNRINSSGFSYDAAGNQVRALISSGAAQRFQYDAANRLAKVKADDNATVLATYTYGDSNERLIAEEGGLRIYYVGEGGSTIAEYIESGGSTTPGWSMSYVYLGRRLLSTLTANGSGGEAVEYHHPDRLGTRLVTNPSAGTSFEQVTLPFGSALNAESTGASNRRFTSYDRSATTGLDYAVNRHYDPLQGRFTQVDPARMAATSLENPQTLNLYSYVGNDPINHTDPSGLGFFSFLKKLFKVLIKVAIVVALVVVAIYLGGLTAGLIVKAASAFAHGAILAGLKFASIAFAAALGAMFVGGMAMGMIYTTIIDIANRCRVPNFAGLSQRRQDELTGFGVTPDQWNNLPNKSRLTYFNVTSAIAAAGLSLSGWSVDWAAGGIQHERVFFIAGPNASDLAGQVISTQRFNHGTNPRSEHGDYTDSFRGGIHPSLQLSFTTDHKRLDADLDNFNPSSGPFGLLFHLSEVTGHKLGQLFGGMGTDPVSVGKRSNWECN